MDESFLNENKRVNFSKIKKTTKIVFLPTKSDFNCLIGIVTFDHYISFKKNFTTTLRLAKNSYFQRKFTECSNNSRDTWKTLNCLIRFRKTSKDVTLNHNGSSISDPSAIAEIFNNYFSNIASNLDRDIPHSNISPLYFLRAHVENSLFDPPPMIVKKLLI